jgi:hypothetical protein
VAGRGSSVEVIEGRGKKGVGKHVTETPEAWRHYRIDRAKREGLGSS